MRKELKKELGFGGNYGIKCKREVGGKVRTIRGKGLLQQINCQARDAMGEGEM